VQLLRVVKQGLRRLTCLVSLAWLLVRVAWVVVWEQSLLGDARAHSVPSFGDKFFI
jgi:hypothetical protein